VNNDFLRAAASYYGMNPDTTATDWQNDGGAMLFTFSIHATEDDMAGILQRMKVMREEEAQRQPEVVFAEGPTTHAIRQQYNAMSKAERSKYGSFGRYVMETNGVTSNTDAALNRKVEHINAPEDSEPVSMNAVWLLEHQTTEVQRRFASDARGEPGDEKQYLIQSAMLTEEQKAQLADGSGGLPG
jgi:hypothetical protein